MVHYNENAPQQDKMILLDATVRDASQHEMVLQSLTALIRMAVQCPHPFDNDNDHIVTVCDLLASLLPNEYQLQSGIAANEKRNEKIKINCQQFKQPLSKKAAVG